MQRIYLDHNATTPLDPRVLDAMLPFLRESYGNASSLHWFGQRARAAVEEARGRVSELVGADPGEIVFTASGSESDNMALRGAAAKARGTRRGLVVSAVEHHAVLNSAKALRDEGFPLAIVARRARTGGSTSTTSGSGSTTTTLVVSVMLANNETGVVQPVAEAARLARAEGRARPLRRRAGRGQGTGRRARARRRPADALRPQALRAEGRGLPLRAARHAAGAARARGRPGAQPPRGHRERRRHRGLRSRGDARARAPRRRSPAHGPAARPARGAASGAPGRAPQRRRAAPRQHRQRLVRRHRRGGAADRPRPRGPRRLDRRRLRRRRRRALPRAPGDGLPAGARAELAAPVAGTREQRSRMSIEPQTSSRKPWIDSGRKPTPDRPPFTGAWGRRAPRTRKRPCSSPTRVAIGE